MNEWRPIETAPVKKRILITDGKNIEPVWNSGPWFIHSATYVFQYVKDSEATHWMPLLRGDTP